MLDCNEHGGEVFVVREIARVDVLHQQFGPRDLPADIVKLRRPESHEICATNAFEMSMVVKSSVSLACGTHPCRMVVEGLRRPDRPFFAIWLSVCLRLGLDLASNMTMCGTRSGGLDEVIAEVANDSVRVCVCVCVFWPGVFFSIVTLYIGCGCFVNKYNWFARILPGSSHVVYHAKEKLAFVTVLCFFCLRHCLSHSAVVLYPRTMSCCRLRLEIGVVAFTP